MKIQTKHYVFTKEEVNHFNHKYDSHFKEIHKYSFWFVSMDIDGDRSETYFDTKEEAYEEYKRVKNTIQSYLPLQHIVHAQDKKIELSLMCHHKFKDENNEDIFWKLNIRNNDFLELEEREVL